MNKPIGYLVKQVDILLTNGIDTIQQAFGLTRTGWQLLNTLSTKGGINRSELTVIMLPFVNEEQLQSLLKQMLSESIILMTSDSRYLLTEKGIQLHRECFEAQKIFRTKLMENISDQEYGTTMQTLQKIIVNLQ